MCHKYSSSIETTALKTEVPRPLVKAQVIRSMWCDARNSSFIFALQRCVETITEYWQGDSQSVLLVDLTKYQEGGVGWEYINAISLTPLNLLRIWHSKRLSYVLKNRLSQTNICTWVKLWTTSKGCLKIHITMHAHLKAVNFCKGWFCIHRQKPTACLPHAISGGHRPSSPGKANTLAESVLVPQYASADDRPKWSQQILNVLYNIHMGRLMIHRVDEGNELSDNEMEVVVTDTACRDEGVARARENVEETICIICFCPATSLDLCCLFIHYNWDMMSLYYVLSSAAWGSWP